MIKNKAMRNRADLHVHTTFSDGCLTPGEVVDKALEIGLGAVAITDHDCVEGVLPAMEAARGKDIEVVPGVEISAASGDFEVHVLGYFIDVQDPRLADTLGKMKRNRIERLRNIIHLLRKEGMDVDESKVLGEITQGTVGRMHIARMMVESGFVRNIHDAFENYLGDGKPCGLRHVRLDFTRAIEMIRDSGGVPVIAHPGTMGNDDHFQDYVAAGLRGVEASHTKHRSGETDRYMEAASKYGLIVTAGSDCHGAGPGKILMGKVTSDISTVDLLREEARGIRIKSEEKRSV